MIPQVQLEDILILAAGAYEQDGFTRLILDEKATAIDKILLRNALEDGGYKITGCEEIHCFTSLDSIDYDYKTTMPIDVYYVLEKEFSYWF